MCNHNEERVIYPSVRVLVVLPQQSTDYVINKKSTWVHCWMSKNKSVQKKKKNLNGGGEGEEEKKGGKEKPRLVLFI